MDTVAVDGPIEAVVEGGVVRSAGDTILGGDDKAACAVLLAVLSDLAATPPPCGFEAVFSTCEEVGLLGAKALDLSALAARAGFVFDSTGPVGDVITRAPSQKALTADFHGVAAHAGIAPEKGRSAIAAAAAAVAAMKLGRIDDVTTANIGRIHGGSALNVVPEHCRVEGEVRSHDPASLAAQTAHMVDAVELAAGVAGIDVEVAVRDAFTGFSLDDGALPVRIACAALQELGIAPRISRVAAAPTSTSTTRAACRASTSVSAWRRSTRPTSICRSSGSATPTGCCTPCCGRPRRRRSERRGRERRARRGAASRSGRRGVPRLPRVRADLEPEHRRCLPARPHAVRELARRPGGRRASPREQSTRRDPEQRG